MSLSLIFPISIFHLIITLIQPSVKQNRFKKVAKIKKSTKKTKKPCKNCYFKTYKRDADIPAEIVVKQPICKIDDLYFHTFAEAGRYLETPRQTIAQAKNRKSKKILGREVEWF